METLQVIESSFVAPKEETPTKGLWLSPVDLAAIRGHTTQVRFYRSGAAFFDVARLKEALAKTLVAFYPVAGRLGVDNDGRLEISCNGEGVLFVVARCCLVAEDFDFSKPSPELSRTFVPRIEPPSLIMAIQVTFLKCGGVALGTANNHAAMDGASASHFMQTWSAFFRDGDGAAIELPCHDRTLLRARSPPVVHPDALSVLYPKVTLLSQSPSRPNATEVFPISREQLAALKRLCGGASTFCSVSALVWKCAGIVRRLPPDSTARLTFPVDVRRCGALKPPLPARYFGNAVVSLCVAGAARDIASEALASVAARISAAIARMDDELVRSGIDYLQLGAKNSWPETGSLPETDFRIVSWLSWPGHDADFGSGAPQVMSPAESVRGGFVHILNDGPVNHRGDAGERAVRVVVCMEAANTKQYERLLYANIANQTSML